MAADVTEYPWSLTQSRGVTFQSMEDNFSADVAEEDGVIVVHVRGEIDMATAGRLRDVIEPHLGPEQRIVLDLASVRFADSSFLTVLVQARGRLTANGGSLVLRNPSAAARALLTVAQAGGLIDADLEEHRTDSNCPLRAARVNADVNATPTNDPSPEPTKPNAETSGSLPDLP